MIFRKAVAADTEFIIDAIIGSEKSGTQLLSWSQIFDITENQVREMIWAVLDEEISEQEWCIENFMIAQQGDTTCAALSAWVEQESGLGSSAIKAQVISYLYPELWKKAALELSEVSKIQIKRKPKALQLEHIYTSEPFRGKGIAGNLIDYTIKNHKNTTPNLKFAEIQFMAENANAKRSYTKCGFLSETKGPISDFGGLTLLPGHQRISLLREI